MPNDDSDDEDGSENGDDNCDWSGARKVSNLSIANNDESEGKRA